MSALPFPCLALITEPRTFTAAPQCPLGPALAGVHEHGHGALGQSRSQPPHTRTFSSPILPPLLPTLDNTGKQRICTSAGLCLLGRTVSCGEGTQQSCWGDGCLQHTAALGSSSSCTATQTWGWGRSRNLLVAICTRCLFIKFQAATVLHLGSLLGSACCKLRSRTGLFSICLSSPGAASFPRTRFSPQFSTGHWPFAAKIPLTSFSPGVSECLPPPVAACSERGAVLLGSRESWCFVPLPAASPSLPSVSAAQAGEKAETLKFSLMERDMEVPSFAKHRLGSE